MYRPLALPSDENSTGLVDLQAASNTSYLIEGSVFGKLLFENFNTSVAIAFSGTNITSFNATLNYTDANLEVHSKLNFYQSMFCICKLHSNINSHEIDCPVRATGEASLNLINITETPLATAAASITYYGDCNSTGPRYSLYVHI